MNEHPETERICHLCGNPATGYASTWTKADGERWYCHGDEDDEPSCYESHDWPTDLTATVPADIADVRAVLGGGL